MTAHDAFGYFGNRYGIEVVGLQGISTAAEAGLQDVNRLVDLIVERRIPAIFVESSVRMNGSRIRISSSCQVFALETGPARANAHNTASNHR